MIIKGDCLDEMKKLETQSVDVVYLDPPFYTQKKQRLSGRDGKLHEFDDQWKSLDDYLRFMKLRLKECYRVLKDTGTIFLHCDRIIDFRLRGILSDIFGEDNFRSEIIWSYKRWSNSSKGLLNNHQVIYMYSKSPEFVFNVLYTDYSETTNLDQIVQLRQRDSNGKVVYKRDKDGKVVEGGNKKGVPLSDVWNIPFLNPKAKERTGYPTQKPVELLKRVLDISSNAGDTVLDPFMGSGTTLVAAKLRNRNFIGIDVSDDAVSIAQRRLEKMEITESQLLKKGKVAYQNKNVQELSILNALGAKVVQRSKKIDGILSLSNGENAAIKIQGNESITESVSILEDYIKKHNSYSLGYVVQMRANTELELIPLKSRFVKVIRSLESQI